MTTEQIHARLIHALTQYDQRQSKRKGYNPHALGIYFERVDQVCNDIKQGSPVRQALLRGFNDRLLDVCLKAVGETISTHTESLNAPVTYSPSVQCPECNGSRKVPVTVLDVTAPFECPTCNGNGVI